MQRHAGAGHWKRPSHTHVVCALVGSGTLLTAEPQLQHPADMCPVRPLLVCVFLVLWESPGKSRGQDYSVCPITTPCHCETHDVINCAKRRLKKLPFFLNFYFVWADLDLSDNLLPQLPAQGLQGVKVKKLTLSENILTLVHPLAFSGTQGLEELRLAHNYLSYVPPDMFTHLPSLKTLDLSYNRFKSLPDDVFAHATPLEQLDLTGNELGRVPTLALTPLVNLRVLTLRNNAVREVAASAFSGLPLDVLDLGDNRVPMRIFPRAFCGLTPRVKHVQAGVRDWSGLQTLLLDHNGLSHVDPCWTKTAWLLQTIDLSGNPVYCDCSLSYLRSFGRQLAFPHAQCAAPAEFAGDLVDAIPADKFNCSEFGSLEETSRECETQCRAVAAVLETPAGSTGGPRATTTHWAFMCELTVLTLTTLRLELLI